MILYRDFLPEKLLNELKNFSSNQKIRKVEFSIGKDTPVVIEKIVKFTGKKLDLAINTVILKRYKTTDKYISKAYYPHTDPKRFTRSDLLLFSITGKADLSIGSSKSIQCVPNMLVRIQPNTKHSITPPKNTGGVREFMFLGLDSTK